MCSDIVIRVSGVSKWYTVNEGKQNKKNWQHFFKLQPRQERIQALKDVSFEVFRGETLGIIGRNGAGKSTLLRVISGITEPDVGSVEVNGVIAPILALQAGFNPQRTGRENVYLKGMVMGLSREEIDECFDDIAAFADIGDFLERPLRAYSSGMRCRLAFAVEFNMKPDILIIDETLAVGDEIFRRNCMDRITTIKENGATIIFVSHGHSLISKLCDRALLIHNSERLLLGSPKSVVERYHDLVYAPLEEKGLICEEIKKQDMSGEFARSPIQHGTAPTGSDNTSGQDFADKSLAPTTRRELVPQGAIIGKIKILNDKGNEVNVLRSSKHFEISFPIRFTQPTPKVRVSLALKTVEGLVVAEDQILLYVDGGNNMVRPQQQVTARFDFQNLLVDGIYTLDALVISKIAGEDVVLHGILDAILLRIEIGNSGAGGGLVRLIKPFHVRSSPFFSRNIRYIFKIIRA